MLFIGIISALAAMGCAVMSWAKGSDLWLIASLGTAFLAAASVIALWVSERPARSEWRGAMVKTLWTLAVAALAPGFVLGVLVWLFMWVVVPMVMIVPLVFGWELIQLEIDPARRPILSPQHA